MISTYRERTPTRELRISDEPASPLSGYSHRIKKLLQLYPNEAPDNVELIHDVFGCDADYAIVPRIVNKKRKLVTCTPVVNGVGTSDRDLYREMKWEGIQMFVTRLVVGSGRENKHGTALKKGKLYAAENLNGDVESFFRIEMMALDVDIDLPLRFPTKPLSTAEHQKTERYTTHIKTWVELYQFMCNHPDECVVVGGPGFRPTTNATTVFRMTEYPKVHMRSRGRDCLWGAIVNAVDVLIGKSSAELVEETLRQDAIVFPSLGSTAIRIRTLNLGLELRKVKGPHTLDSVCAIREGVLIVRLTRGCAADHVVAIDLSTRLILDSAEEYPLKLTQEALGLCVGEGLGKPFVRECRRLIKVK